MSGVGAYGSTSLGATRSDAAFRDLKADLARLQAQLSTGRVADNYAGLGAGAATSLSGRSALSSVAGHQSNVGDAGVRLSLMGQGVTRLAEIASSLASSLPPSLGAGPIGQTSTTLSAEEGLRQAIELLNTEVDGRYLFSGRSPDIVPVASYDAMLDGEPGRAGLRQLIAERKEADAGPDGRGRLAVGGAGSAATLTEEAAGLPFGLKVASATATGTAISAGRSAGPPAAASITLGGQPAAGDTVTLEFGLPDGSRETLTLTATAAGQTGTAANGFAIGVTPDDTAANLRAALDTAVAGLVTTKLASASAHKAANSFLAGSLSGPPERVAGPPFATATALVTGSAANTVIWYRGDDAAGSARETAPVRVGEGPPILIGARANEPGIRAVLVSLAALAAESFPAGDPTANARYAALATRISAAAGSAPLAQIAADLSIAHGQIGAAKSRLAAEKAQIEDTLAGAENANPSEVAAKLLATQTRLQASYQTTSTVARMSLLDFI